MQIESLLAFFEDNRDKLDDANWILLLHHFLFESQILLKTLNDPKQRESVIRQFDDFFNKQQQNAALKGNFTLIGNLMMVEGTLKAYLAHTATSADERQSYLSLEKVRVLLQQGLQEEHRDQRPVFLEGLAAYCSQVGFAASAKNEDTETAIIVNLLTKQHPVRGGASSLPFRAKQASSLADKVVEHFTQALNQPRLLSEDSLKTLTQAFAGLERLQPSAGQPNCLETANRDTKISLSSGELATSNARLKGIKRKPNEEIIEKLVNLKLYTREEAGKLICEVSRSTTYIEDPQKGLKFISQDNTTYVDLKGIGLCKCIKTEDVKETNDELSHRFGLVA